MNDLLKYADVLKSITPWSGEVPKGFFVDFLGTITDSRFQVLFEIDPDDIAGGQVTGKFPDIRKHGEGWFEALNWVEAAREARGRFVMITLGACYGAQAIGSYNAIQRLNPMPCKLVAVEPEPGSYLWLEQHLRLNGVDPDDHWLLQTAIGDSNDPVLFPVGATGSGSQNCFSTNHESSRAYYADEIIRTGRVTEALQNLLLHNTTGLTKDLIAGYDFKAEIKYVSAVTQNDLLGPFNFVDYLESDIQQSEILVFPPCMDLLKKKVRRVHIGTHGIDAHTSLHQLFEEKGWEIIFSYEPDSRFDTPFGTLVTSDGVLTARNPDL